MAVQEIGCIDIEIRKEGGEEKVLSDTSARIIQSERLNGTLNNAPESNFSEEDENLEKDINATSINIKDYSYLNCDTMPAEVSDVLKTSSQNEKESSYNTLLEKATEDLSAISTVEEAENTSSSSPLERINSTETSSSDSLNSEDSLNHSLENAFNHDDFINDKFGKKEHNCLLHPAYSLVLNQMDEKQREIIQLENTILRLRESSLSVENEKSMKIKELEQFLHQYERELGICKKEQEIEKRTFEAMKKEIEHKCAVIKKEFDTANKERESMVMRYAVSEKELIDVKKEKDNLIKKVKDVTKENDSLMEKVKTLVAEKSKISQLLDNKSTDLSNAHKEIDKLKEEINSRDIKIKWTQSKLKTEIEVHKDCPVQIDKLMTKTRILEEELNSAKLEIQNLKKELQETELKKALESQLKEEQAKLIMERHEHSEIETKYKSLKSKHQSIIEENNSLSIQVQRLETERLEMEKKLSSSREETERLSNIVSDLQSKLVEMDSLTSQLKQSEDKVSSLINEMERVRHQNEELLQDMSACRARETEMLSFTQKLTTKNVQLQSEFSSVETKASDLEKSEEKCKNKMKELKEQVNDLQNQLSKEKAKRDEETRLLARQVAEKKRKGELVEAELIDTKAALTQTKQKHSTVVKDLQRELTQLRRKLEKLEAPCSFRQSESLNSLSDSNFIQTCELPTQNLVDRILKLQGDNAKQAEKIEFLEEHSAHLLSEVQRKSRLLQSYMLREEAGALAPSYVDNHKAEVTKHGGIMASLYGAAPQDDGMSLELCLEINRKLQAVLEDTLLKNIMLKENLDTLGDEISRLTGKK